MELDQEDPQLHIVHDSRSGDIRVQLMGRVQADTVLRQFRCRLIHFGRIPGEGLPLRRFFGFSALEIFIIRVPLRVSRYSHSLVSQHTWPESCPRHRERDGRRPLR